MTDDDIKEVCDHINFSLDKLETLGLRSIDLADIEVARQALRRMVANGFVNKYEEQSAARLSRFLAGFDLLK